MKDLTIKEFKQIVLERLEKFEKEHIAGQIEQPENFPEKMPEGEWWEQFYVDI